MLLLLRHVGQPENPAIGQLELEHYIARLAGAAFEDEADLEIGLGELARVDVDLDRDVRTLLLGPKRARRVRILEREVLHILRERVKGGSSGGGRAVARRIGHLKKLLGARSLQWDRGRSAVRALRERPRRLPWIEWHHKLSPGCPACALKSSGQGHKRRATPYMGSKGSLPVLF